MRQHFSEREIAEVSLKVAAIRAFNMLNATFQTPVPDQPYVASE